MTIRESRIENKHTELKKYHELVLLTIDYYINYTEGHIKTAEFDSIDHYKKLRTQSEEDFQKGRLTRLKQWFRDLTEMFVEQRDLKFSQYLQEKTKYEIDIFKSYIRRVDKIIEKGKIITDNQFYDIKMMVDQLCRTEPIDHTKIQILNRLIADYEYSKSRRIRSSV